MSRGGRPCVPYGAEDDVLCGVCKDKIRYDNLARHNTFKICHTANFFQISSKFVENF